MNTKVLSDQQFECIVRASRIAAHEPNVLRERLDEIIMEFRDAVRPPSSAFEVHFQEAASAPPELPRHLKEIIAQCDDLRRSVLTNLIVKAALLEVADEDRSAANAKIRDVINALQNLKGWAERGLKTKRHRGRKKDSSLTTALMSLADTYIDHFAEQENVWELPASERSPFIKFCTGVLQHVGKRDFTEDSVAKYWRGLRRQMRPTTIRTSHPRTK